MPITFQPAAYNHADFGRCIACGKRVNNAFWDWPVQVYMKDGQLWLPSEIKRLTTLARLFIVGPECRKKIAPEYIWECYRDWCDGHEKGGCAACTKTVK